MRGAASDALSAKLTNPHCELRLANGWSLSRSRGLPRSLSIPDHLSGIIICALRHDGGGVRGARVVGGRGNCLHCGDNEVCAPAKDKTTLLSPRRRRCFLKSSVGERRTTSGDFPAAADEIKAAAAETRAVTYVKLCVSMLSPSAGKPSHFTLGAGVKTQE